jgi:hypothetical protein
VALPPPRVRATSAFGAQHGHPAQGRTVQRQGRRGLDLGVADQHEPGGRAPATRRRPRPRATGPPAGPPDRSPPAPHPGGQPQQPQHLVVDRRLRHAALADGGDQPDVPRAAGAGHDQVQPGLGGRLGRPGGVPVRHDHPVEAPLVRVVGHEVLHGGGDPTGLHPAHVGDADAGGEERVLAEAFEVPAAVGERCRFTVGASSTSTPLRRASPASSRPSRSTPASFQLAAGGSGTGCWRRDPVRPTTRPAPRPGRRTAPPAQPDGRLRMQGPEVGAGEQPYLLLERQRCQPLTQDGLHPGYLPNPAVSPLRSWRRPMT